MCMDATQWGMWLCLHYCFHSCWKPVCILAHHTYWYNILSNNIPYLTTRFVILLLEKRLWTDLYISVLNSPRKIKMQYKFYDTNTNVLILIACLALFWWREQHCVAGWPTSSYWILAPLYCNSDALFVFPRRITDEGVLDFVVMTLTSSVIYCCIYQYPEDCGTRIQSEDSICIIQYSFYSHNHVSIFLYKLGFLGF